jgi:hypothetical protein
LHPQAHLANCTGIFQADAYDGYRKLYEPGRRPGPILEAACRVAGMLPSPPLTDPDVRITRIRFFTRKLPSGDIVLVDDLG